MKIERFNEGRERQFDIYHQEYNTNSEEDFSVLIRDLNDLDEHDIKYYMFSRNNSYYITLYFKRTTIEVLHSLIGFYNSSYYANMAEAKKSILLNGGKLINREDLENLKFLIPASKFNI